PRPILRFSSGSCSLLIAPSPERKSPTETRSGLRRDDWPPRTACEFAWKRVCARAILRTFASRAESPARRRQSSPAGGPVRLETSSGTEWLLADPWVLAWTVLAAGVPCRQFPACGRYMPAVPRAARAQAGRDTSRHEPEAPAGCFPPHRSPRIGG